jgi:hypothetical protein
LGIGGGKEHARYPRRAVAVLEEKQGREAKIKTQEKLVFAWSYQPAGAISKKALFVYAPTLHLSLFGSYFGSNLVCRRKDCYRGRELLHILVVL